MYRNYINKPKLETGKHFSLVINAWEEHARLFNADVEEYNEAFKNHPNFVKRQPLRAAHREVFFRMCHILSTQFSIDNQRYANHPETIRIKIGSDVTVRTNNLELAQDTSRSKATINRLLNRMLKAQVITQRVGHGCRANIDLTINGDLLPISDAKDGFLAIPKILESSSLSVVKKFKNSKCDLPTESKSNLNIKNKKMEVDNSTSDKVDATASNNATNQNANRNKNQNAGKCSKTPTETISEICKRGALNAGKKQTETEPKQNSSGGAGVAAPPKTAPVTVAKWKAAEIILQFAISLLWSGKFRNSITEVYDTEYTKTLEYIAENYFEHITPTNEAFDTTIRNYKKRLGMAQRFVKRKLDKGIYNSWYQSPSNYFKKSNKNGFEATKAWYLKDKGAKIERKEAAKDRDKLATAIKRVRESDYNLSVFNSRYQYLETNYPHLLTDFCKELEIQQNAIQES